MYTGPFLLVAYRTFSKLPKRTVKKDLLKKYYSKWFHKISWYLQDFQNQFKDPFKIISAFKQILRKEMSQKYQLIIILNNI